MAYKKSELTKHINELEAQILNKMLEAFNAEVKAVVDGVQIKEVEILEAVRNLYELWVESQAQLKDTLDAAGLAYEMQTYSSDFINQLDTRTNPVKLRHTLLQRTPTAYSIEASYNTRCKAHLSFLGRVQEVKIQFHAIRTNLKSLTPAAGVTYLISLGFVLPEPETKKELLVQVDRNILTALISAIDKA